MGDGEATNTMMDTEVEATPVKKSKLFSTGRAKWTNCFQNHISVVAELGFGAGLSILETIQRFRQVASPHARLCLISLEQFPIDPNVLKEMLMHDGAAPDLVSALIDQWPIHVGGWHRLSFLEGRVHLTLGLGDAADLLPTMNFKADAWFLDGFSPAKNPDLWTPKVLKMVTDRSASGARLGTWCSAGDVRRTLTELGWAVERVPGHATKRHRLEARRSGTTPNRPSPGNIHIAGAGFAGAGARGPLLSAGGLSQSSIPKGLPRASGKSKKPCAASLGQRLGRGKSPAFARGPFCGTADGSVGGADKRRCPASQSRPSRRESRSCVGSCGNAGCIDSCAVDEDEASKLAGFRVGSGLWFASARSVSGPEYVAALLDHDNIGSTRRNHDDAFGRDASGVVHRFERCGCTGLERTASDSRTTGVLDANRWVEPRHLLWSLFAAG